MSLKEGVKADAVAALKAADKLKVSTLRLLLSELHNRQIELKRELSDEESSLIVARLIRQRKESIEQFKRGGRDDLVEKETSELSILKGYMPEQLSAEQVRPIVKQAAERIGAEGMKDMGRLMKEVMGELKGKAEGRVINELVKEVLGG